MRRPPSCCGKNPLGTPTNKKTFHAIVPSNTKSVIAGQRSTPDGVRAYVETIQLKPRSLVSYSHPCDFCSFSRWAHIIGVVVRDTTIDTAIAADSVMANSRNKRP